MTRERLKGLLDSGVLQAAVDGEPLQYRMGPQATWFDAEGFPSFDVETVEFRIKPKLNTPKVVRFGDLDEQTREQTKEWCVVWPDGRCEIVRTYYMEQDYTVVLPV